MSPASPRSVVGQRLRRPDAPDKVKGSAMYVEDLIQPGTLFGGVLRSPHAHARIRKLDARPRARHPRRARGDHGEARSPAAT